MFVWRKMSKYDVTRADVAKTVKYIVYFQSQTYVIWNLTFGRTRKFIPPPWYGGGGDRTPPRSFWYVAVFRNDFTFSGKPLIFLTRWSIFYGWWRCWKPVTSTTMVSNLAAILILPRIRNQAKPARNRNFLALHEKWHINKHLLF